MVTQLKLLSPAIFLVAAMLASSVASAQAPDGSPAGSQEQPAAAGDSNQQPAVAVLANCGTQFFSRVATQNALGSTSSTSFRNLASFSFSVPSGAARCIKVLFTAEAACRGSSGTDFCYVRALINGAEMFPQGGGFQALQSEDPSSAGHAFEWFRRVGPGTYTVTLQWRTGSAATTFFIDDWTVDFQLTT